MLQASTRTRFTTWSARTSWRLSRAADSTCFLTPLQATTCTTWSLRFPPRWARACSSRPPSTAISLLAPQPKTSRTRRAPTPRRPALPRWPRSAASPWPTSPSARSSRLSPVCARTVPSTSSSLAKTLRRLALWTAPPSSRRASRHPLPSDAWSPTSCAVF